MEQQASDPGLQVCKCWTWLVCFVFAGFCVVVLGNVVACVVLLVIFRFVRYQMVMVPLVVFIPCGFVLLFVVFLFSLTWLPGVVSHLYEQCASELFLGFGECFVLRLDVVEGEGGGIFVFFVLVVVVFVGGGVVVSVVFVCP